MQTDSLYDKIKTRFDHQQSKQVLAEKYQAKLVFAHNGGLWKANPELINILVFLQNKETAVIVDIQGTPVKINPSDLLEQVLLRWQEQMNAWYNELEALSGQR
jgi:hypothetical protein